MSRSKQFGPALPVLALSVVSAGLLWLVAKSWTNYVAAQASDHRSLAAAAGNLAEHRRLQALVEEKKAWLRASGERLPSGDGYIWLTKMLAARHPKIRFSVAPCEYRIKSVVSDSSYCAGLFRVRGVCSFPECAAVLGSIETEMPFAHVSDLLIQVTDLKNEQVDFSFSVTTILRPDKDLSF